MFKTTLKKTSRKAIKILLFSGILSSMFFLANLNYGFAAEGKIQVVITVNGSDVIQGTAFNPDVEIGYLIAGGSTTTKTWGGTIYDTPKTINNVPEGNYNINYSFNLSPIVFNSRIYTLGGITGNTNLYVSDNATSTFVMHITLILVSRPPAPSLPQCSDGIDNDNDGKIDFPADPGCFSNSDNSEINLPPPQPSLPQCSDRIDNDNDGKIDFRNDLNFPADDDCVSPQDNDEDDDIIPNPNNEQCEDGIDNDNDGKIDALDPACHTDRNANNSASYDQNLNNENSKPVITLLGNSPATTTQGSVYTDAGATAFDDEDGNITSIIVVSGDTISTTTPAGTYTIIFTVADSKGLTASTTRIVIVNSNQNNGGGNNNNGGGNNGGNNGGGNNTGGGDNTGGNNSGGGGAVNIASANGPIGFSGLPLSFATQSTPATTGTVLGAKTEKALSDKCNYLSEYIKFGRKNNPFEVKKLQYFLKNIEGFKQVKITGIYDEVSLKAVHNFQKKYNEDILQPWSLPDSTGYVYITTKKKVNEIYCEKAFPLTVSQKSEIKEYSDLMKRLRAALTTYEEVKKVATSRTSESVNEETGKIEKVIAGTRNNEGMKQDELAREYAKEILNAPTSTPPITAGLLDLVSLVRSTDNSEKSQEFENGLSETMSYFFRHKTVFLSAFLLGPLILFVY